MKTKQLVKGLPFMLVAFLINYFLVYLALGWQGVHAVNAIVLGIPLFIYLFLLAIKIIFSK